MAQLIALPIAALLTELGVGATISAAAVELGVTAGLAEIAGTAAIGTVAGTAAGAIATQVETQLPETSKKVNDILNSVISASNAAAYTNAYGFSTFQTTRNEVIRGSNTPTTNQPVVPTSGTNDSSKITKVIDPDKLSPYPGTQLLIDADAGQTATGQGTDFEESLGSLVSDIVGGLGNNKESYRPEELAELLVGYSSEMAVQSMSGNVDPVKALQDVVGNNTRKIGLAERFSNYLATKTLPTNQEFLEIAAVYNGKNLRVDRFLISKIEDDIVTTGFNELNERATMKKLKKGLPQLHGFYVGPGSQGGERPVDFLDYAAYLHDVSYNDGGYFHRRGDLQLVSRISQNMDRIEPDVQSLAKSMIVYFSTLGLTIGSIKGSLTGNIEDDVNNSMTKDDLFPVLVPSALSLPEQEYKHARYEYYNQLEKDFKEVESTSSIMATSGGNYRTRLLAAEFGSIMIQIL